MLKFLVRSEIVAQFRFMPWVGFLVMVFAPSAQADNYEMSGTVNIDNKHAFPFYFRWDNGRWMVCETNDESGSQYEWMCLSSDGTNLISSQKNRPDNKAPKLVPYQMSISSGFFPLQDVSYFGVIAAALEPSFLNRDLNEHACALICPPEMEGLYKRAVTNYAISFTSPSPLLKILSIKTDKIATEGTALTNGWEIFHMEITYQASNPNVPEQFVARYQNPDFSQKNPGDIHVVREVSGSVSSFRSLTNQFDAWPRTDGETAVVDNRVVNGTNPFARTYFTPDTEIEGKPMPPIHVTDWVNGQVTPSDMKGKVVLVDFYATWCGPCMASIPYINELLKKYKDQGLVIVGICTSNQGPEKMETAAKDRGIEYPTAKDSQLLSEAAWHIEGFPTYAVVDRKGIVRAISFEPRDAETVIKKLLAEPAP